MVRRRAAAAMRRQADTRTNLDPPETPLSGDIAACSLAVTYAERHDSMSSAARCPALSAAEACILEVGLGSSERPCGTC